LIFLKKILTCVHLQFDIFCFECTANKFIQMPIRNGIWKFYDGIKQRRSFSNRSSATHGRICKVEPRCCPKKLAVLKRRSYIFVCLLGPPQAGICELEIMSDSTLRAPQRSLGLYGYSYIAPIRLWIRLVCRASAHLALLIRRVVAICNVACSSGSCCQCTEK